MKHFLFYAAAALLFAVIIGASMLWPSLVIWVAWMAVALLVFSGRMLSEQLGEAEASRDRGWAYARGLEVEVERLQREIERQGEEVRRLAAMGEELRQIGASLQAELTRFRPYTEPRLFAAAVEVLAAHDDPGNIEAIEETLVRLDQAVVWWDGLAGAELEQGKEEVTDAKDN